LPLVDYLLVQHPADRIQSSPGGLAIQSSMVSSASAAAGASAQQKNPIMVGNIRSAKIILNVNIYVKIYSNKNALNVSLFYSLSYPSLLC
jgi:hypothetical protein